MVQCKSVLVRGPAKRGLRATLDCWGGKELVLRCANFVPRVFYNKPFKLFLNIELTTTFLTSLVVKTRRYGIRQQLTGFRVHPALSCQRQTCLNLNLISSTSSATLPRSYSRSLSFYFRSTFWVKNQGAILGFHLWAKNSKAVSGINGANERAEVQANPTP